MIDNKNNKKDIRLSSKEYIQVINARTNNLKNLCINIPKNKLIVITGLSGSGKSSLAFDTIFAEGQRKYLESLSSYARQFLGNIDKPDVDSIEGLSPTISVDQKSTSHNPRSTVGTVTEIYDYLRVLYARVGEAYCPNGHGIINTQTIKQVLDIINSYNENDKIQIFAVLHTQEKGTFKNELEQLKQYGFLRVRIDNKIMLLDDKIELSKTQKHNIEIVVDRIVLHFDQTTKSRINDALEIASKYGKGKIIISRNDQELLFNLNHACKICNFSISEIEPRLFSFNLPFGACDNCKGLGFTYEPNENLLIPNKYLSIDEGGIDYFKNTVGTLSIDWQKYKQMLDYYKVPTNIAINELNKEQMNYVLYGSDDKILISLNSNSGRKYEQYTIVEGIIGLIKRRHLETKSEFSRNFYSRYITEEECKTCKGLRLSNKALSIKIDNLNIIDFTNLAIDKELDFLLNLKLTNEKMQIAKLAMKEIIDRLTFLKNVGLEYLNLSRSANSLSGGEAQRIRLASQIGSHLTGILYVLDEPSIGLHQKDNSTLIQTLKSMRDLGNTLLVVEHDEETMLNSDYLIDIGPGAGSNGGELVACGTIKDIIKSENSITGKYLSGKLFIPIPTKRRSGNQKSITIKGAHGNNLKNITVSFPLGMLIAVTGVSGSGKSTLINETLVKGLELILFKKFLRHAPFKIITGEKNIDKIIKISQEPIGRTPRSNPATYISVFDDIRELFSSIPSAKIRGFDKGRFSFNLKGGRCENCQGDGIIKIEMHFLPDVYVKCKECDGKKYNEETLNIKYKNKSIYDVLEMTVLEASDFFSNIPPIKHKLELMKDVGLGYIKLGTSSLKLSGGEAQRIKLAKFLQRPSTGKTLFILDEPTTGLHTHDVYNLLKILQRIVDAGDTVIVIEHNLDVIKVADWIIDLGPDGGDKGGKIVAFGPPEKIIKKADVSYTAKYLEKHMYHK